MDGERPTLFFGDFCDSHANSSIVEAPEGAGMEVAVVVVLEWEVVVEVSFLPSMSFNVEY